MKRPYATMVCLTALLGVIGCAVSPQNGQQLISTDQPLFFSGFAAVPGQRVHVQVQNCATGAWTTTVSTTAGRGGLPMCGTRVYWWRAPIVTLPQEDAAWCHHYGVTWVNTRVVDDAGRPLLSVGRPYGDGCDVSDPCDPSLVERCANGEGVIMLMCTEDGGGCIDRLR